MIKAALFDLDGTLLNTLETIRYYLNLTFRKYNIPELGLDDTRSFVGNGAGALIRRALLAVGIDPDADIALTGAITEEYVESYNSEPLPLTEPYMNIFEALNDLRSAGIKLAVISNKPHETVRRLAEHYFPALFSEVYGQREGVPLKPSPEAPLAICKLLAVNPNEVAYFGDSGVDMKTGSAFGAALTVGVSWGFCTKEELAASGADVIIDSANEIASLALEQK